MSYREQQRATRAAGGPVSGSQAKSLATQQDDNILVQDQDGAQYPSGTIKTFIDEGTLVPEKFGEYIQSSASDATMIAHSEGSTTLGRHTRAENAAGGIGGADNTAVDSGTLVELESNLGKLL